MAILLAFGLLGSFHKPKDFHIYAKEGVLIVALCWILWSFFGALPFVFSGQIQTLSMPSLEVSSGFTTTGATILDDVGVLSHSLLFGVVLPNFDRGWEYWSCPCDYGQ